MIYIHSGTTIGLFSPYSKFRRRLTGANAQNNGGKG
jgi:hypothetical protein